MVSMAQELTPKMLDEEAPGSKSDQPNKVASFFGLNLGALGAAS